MDEIATHFLSPDDALELLARSPTHQLAQVIEGRPLLRPVHAVLAEGWLAFHSASDATRALGSPAVIAAEDLITDIPSYFRSPDRGPRGPVAANGNGCAAGSLYESAQLEGPLEAVDDRPTKLLLLRALMDKHQPEGRYTLPDPSRKAGRASIDAVLVAGIRVEGATLHSRANLARHSSDAAIASLLKPLWQRGTAGDLRAIARLRAERPTVALPEPFTSPLGAVWRLDALVPRRAAAADLAAVVELLRDRYWNAGIYDDGQLAALHRASAAWVVARETTSGELIGSARATADGVKVGTVSDVVVDERYQGRGVGLGLMRLLLDHAALREVRTVRLATRDAEGFYARLGFRPAAELDRCPQLALRRGCADPATVAG
jgi:N-acetylglutamate synthase-like GNAT family acetyltransferase